MKKISKFDESQGMTYGVKIKKQAKGLLVVRID